MANDPNGTAKSAKCRHCGKTRSTDKMDIISTIRHGFACGHHWKCKECPNPYKKETKMKQLHYSMKVKNVGDPDNKGWKEEISEIVADSVTRQQHAQDIITSFNEGAILRRESLRQLIYTVDLGDQGLEKLFKHNWRKTSLVTEKGGFDRMQCTNCKATGKRYGLGDNVRPDGKFKQFCILK